MPTYPEIRLALAGGARVRRMLDDFDPERIHIATEGPLGLAARALVSTTGSRLHHVLPYALSRVRQDAHTGAGVLDLPAAAMVPWSRRPAPSCPSRSQRDDLARKGFRDLVVWGRGVDTALFRPERRIPLAGERPILMYMGRVAIEKNIEAFLRILVPGTKYVVGDGPALEQLRREWPDVRFLGPRYREELAGVVAAADVFVFPSRTDTFGVVLLEAMACGVPVAAYPVTGPVDVVENGVTGILDEDLDRAVEGALKLERGKCRAQALRHSWEAATAQFARALVPSLPVDDLGQPGRQLRPEGEQHQGH